jgi:hypothetical protein
VVEIDGERDSAGHKSPTHCPDDQKISDRSSGVERSPLTSCCCAKNRVTGLDASAEHTPPLHPSLSSDEVLDMVELSQLTTEKVVDERICPGGTEYKCQITVWLPGYRVKKTKAGGKQIGIYEQRLKRDSRICTLRKMPHRVKGRTRTRHRNGM